MHACNCLINDNLNELSAQKQFQKKKDYFTDILKKLNFVKLIKHRCSCAKTEHQS